MKKEENTTESIIGNESKVISKKIEKIGNVTFHILMLSLIVFLVKMVVNNYLSETRSPNLIQEGIRVTKILQKSVSFKRNHPQFTRSQLLGGFNKTIEEIDIINQDLEEIYRKVDIFKDVVVMLKGYLQILKQIVTEYEFELIGKVTNSGIEKEVDILNQEIEILKKEMNEFKKEIHYFKQINKSISQILNTTLFFCGEISY